MPFGLFNAYVPTEGGTGAQRANAFFQLIGGAISKLDTNLTPKVQIPQKFSQFCMSMYAACRSDVAVPERIQHAGLALIAGGELALAVTMLVKGIPCDTADSTNDLCQSDVILELFYVGLLAVSYGAAEIMTYGQRVAQRAQQNQQGILPVYQPVAQQNPVPPRNRNCAIM
ncbi:hypothetical protein ACNVED_00350 [Legionella sp. D16C41]|uniref:hypothetical protein n=1 Tax=Legionella sp. D16C41 TaxID=3402688 RepID=UPI003AF7D459